MGRRAPLHPVRPWPALLAGFVALAVYVPRVCPTLSLMGDSAVFVTAARELGVAQPSGYPLWTWLGRLASALPFGEVPHRLHLLSALTHAVTVGLVAHTLGRLTGQVGAAVGAALSLAFARAFFQGSLYAEVFPLLDLFTALAVWVALEASAARRRARPRWLLGFALVAGLASTHHQMIALTAPGLLALLLAADAHRVLRADRLLLGRILVAFTAPSLVLYGAIPLLARREPRGSWGDVRGFDDLARLVTRQDYGGVFSPHLGVARAPWDTSVAGWLEGVTAGFTTPLAIGVAAGIVLVALSARADASRRPWTVALLLVAIVSGPVFAAMNGLEVMAGAAGEHGRAYAERFSTMSMVPLALLLGSALAVVPLPAALRPGVAFVFLIPLLTHAQTVDLRADRRGAGYAHDLLRGVPDGSLVLLSGDPANGAQLWVCGVERACGTSIVFSPGQMHLDWRRRQLARRHPDLVLPPPRKVVLPQGERLLVSTRELVLANAGRRRIFLSPDLLDREPGLAEAAQFLPFGLLIEAVDEPTFLARKATFLAQAEALARHAGCEGCGLRRSELPPPSLETSLPFAYALAYENHARVLRAWFPTDPRALTVAADLEAQAEVADREGVLRLRK